MIPNDAKEKPTVNVANISPDIRVYDIVSIVAYMAGVNYTDYGKGPFKDSIFTRLHEDDDAHTIRSLCRIRTALMRSFKRVQDAMAFQMRNLHTLPEYIPQNDVEFLVQRGVKLLRVNWTAQGYIADINQLLMERINSCERLFPIWLKWGYIRDLFLMPHGRQTDAIEAERARYAAEQAKYPYRVYLNVQLIYDGNLFLHDGKLLYWLYQMHDDCFTDFTKVTDACRAVKENLYTYLLRNPVTAMIVDCENSDPYRICAVLRNIQENCPEGFSHIQKVVLYDDVNTSVTWRILELYINAPIEHEVIERVKNQKSLVDIWMTARTCKLYYEDHIPAYILVSSDSDYWGLMSALPDASFLVLTESEKTGFSLRSALNSKSISYCNMDEFYSGNISDIKLGALMVELKPYIAERMFFNIHTLMDMAIERTRISLTDQEKARIYRHVKKNLRLKIMDNGDVKVIF